MVKIAPSILSADFLNLEEEIKAVEEAGADMLHIDIMDGHFVPNITIGPFIVEQIRKIASLPLDVHLMIEKPANYLKDFIRAGADYLTVHLEACIHLHRTVQWIKERDVKAGVSLNPATPVSSLENILSDIHLALLMSVDPGFGGQKFIPQVLEKIRTLKKSLEEKGLSTVIEVDGGINIDNAKNIASAGADILVMGSAVFDSGDYRGVLKGVREHLAN